LPVEFCWIFLAGEKSKDQMINHPPNTSQATAVFTILLNLSRVPAAPGFIR
jgi:hypothetical protein